MSLLKRINVEIAIHKFFSRGINVEQQVTKPNAEIQLKAPDLYLRPGVNFLQGLEYIQPKIETGFI